MEVKRCEAARFIVCEKTGQWAAAFRRALTKPAPRVHETRSVAECWEELDASPASLLALELTESNVEFLVTKLVELSRSRPAARAMVLASRSMQPHQWLLREAGAIHVAISPRRLESAAALVRRHLARAPQLEKTTVETIWDRLPWSA